MYLSRLAPYEMLTTNCNKSTQKVVGDFFWLPGNEQNCGLFTVYFTFPLFCMTQLDM